MNYGFDLYIFHSNMKNKKSWSDSTYLSEFDTYTDKKTKERNSVSITLDRS